MLKTLAIFFLFSVVPCIVAQDVSGVPPLPSDPSAWTDETVFYAGFIAGSVVGASGFLLRILRQPAKQNPEI